MPLENNIGSCIIQSPRDLDMILTLAEPSPFVFGYSVLLITITLQRSLLPLGLILLMSTLL